MRAVPSAGQLLTSAEKHALEKVTSIKSFKKVVRVAKLAALDITICPSIKAFFLYKDYFSL